MMLSCLRTVLSGVVFAMAVSGSAAPGFHREGRIPGIDRIYAWPVPDRLLVRTSAGIQLLDLKTRQPFWTAEQQGMFVAADHDGKQIVVVDKRDGVHLLDGRTGARLRQIRPPKKYRNAISGLAVIPSGQMFAIGTGDYSVHLHQLPSGYAFRTLASTFKRLQIAFSPNNLRLAAPDSFDGISLYDTRNWLRSGRLQWDPRIGGGATRIVFSPDSQRLAAFVRGEVWLWDLRTRQVMRKFPARFGASGMIAFSPDGKWLAASGMWPLKKDDMYAAVGVWNTDTGAGVATLTDLEEGNHSDGLRFAFSPDGRRIAIAFPHLDQGPAAITWRWGEKPEEPKVGFHLTVNTRTARGKAAGTKNVRVAVRVNGDAARQAVLDHPGTREFKRGASDTFSDLAFNGPLEQVESLQLFLLGGDDAWELRDIAFQFSRDGQQSRRYFFQARQWFSMKRTDAHGRAVQHMDFKLSPKPSETLR